MPAVANVDLDVEFSGVAVRLSAEKLALDGVAYLSVVVDDDSTNPFSNAEAPSIGTTLASNASPCLEDQS